MLYRDFAHTFDTDLGLAEMLARLNELGPWKWSSGDGDRLGDYISARALPRPQRGLLKIFVDRGASSGRWGQASNARARFVIQVNLASDEDDAKAKFDEIERGVIVDVLPAIGARNVAKSDTYE